MKLKIIAGHVELEAELDSSDISKDLIKTLPLELEASKWGAELYFILPEMLDYPGQADEVEVGDVAYWPNGPAICVFFGPTPGSFTDKPRPQSVSVVIGKIKNIEEKISELAKVAEGSKVRIEKAGN